MLSVLHDRLMPFSLGKVFVLDEADELMSRGFKDPGALRHCVSLRTYNRTDRTFQDGTFQDHVSNTTS